MKCSITLIFILSFVFLSFGQKNTVIDKEDNIYFDLVNKEPYFFVKADNKDDRVLVKEDNKLSLKKNTVSFYSKWLNPLRYNLIFQDSFYLDPRDKAIQDYIKKVLNQFNVSNEEAITSGFSEDLTNKSMSSFQFVRSDMLELLEVGKSITIPSDNVKRIFEILVKIEAREIQPEKNALQLSAKKLFEVKLVSNADQEIKNAEETLKNVTSSYKLDLYRLTQLEEALKDLKSTSESYLKLKVSSWLKSENEKLEWNKKHTAKLAEYTAIIKKSLNDSSEVSGYYYIRTFELPEGKESLSKLQLRRNSLKSENLSIESVETTTKKFTIKRYDFIKPSIGSGLFYANTTLNTFGVSTNDDGELEVSEDNLEESTAVTALFLNLNFDLNSRYLSPLLQIGIDPTKKRPFLLLGGGISIPSSNFSITGGPIWTWTASLEELKVDEVVESSTDVENDISYSFNVEPQGFYLGLTFSF